MAGSQHDGHLGAVYEARKPDEIAALYDSWAETYDAEMAKFGYRHPAICLALLARHLPRGAEPLLDAGAGTGQVGEWLALVGYPNVEALDLSAGMLAVAARKKCYSKLHQLALGSALPFADRSFAAVISSGVFTTGHVGAEALDELIRICKCGGVLVLTIKDTVWETGMASKIEALESTHKAQRVEETLPYVSMPGETNVVPSRAVVLKVA
jgi:ubiquinone/menaquinone biosynthesis C-methylase UbiE